VVGLNEIARLCERPASGRAPDSIHTLKSSYF
jgi:hypothetical protein